MKLDIVIIFNMPILSNLEDFFNFDIHDTQVVKQYARHEIPKCLDAKESITEVVTLQVCR